MPVLQRHWVEVVFACEHTVAVQRMRALPERLCPECWTLEKAGRDAAWEERKQEGRARAAELKPGCYADARVDAEDVWHERGYDRLPEFLHRRARSELVSKLTFSLLGERAFGKGRAPELLALVAELDALAQLPEGALLAPGAHTPGAAGSRSGTRRCRVACRDSRRSPAARE